MIYLFISLTSHLLMNKKEMLLANIIKINFTAISMEALLVLVSHSALAAVEFQCKDRSLFHQCWRFDLIILLNCFSLILRNDFPVTTWGFVLRFVFLPTKSTVVEVRVIVAQVVLQLLLLLMITLNFSIIEKLFLLKMVLLSLWHWILHCLYYWDCYCWPKG